MLDRYADTAIVMAITLGYAAGHPGVLPWLGGLAASTGFLLASYSTKEFALTHGVPYPDNVLNRLKRRDLRLLVMCCGGLAGYPFYAMVVMGLLTHGLIVGILVNGWRFRPPDARAAVGVTAPRMVKSKTPLGDAIPCGRSTTPLTNLPSVQGPTNA